MIHAFKQQLPNGFLVTAYYRMCDKPKFYNRLTTNELVADNSIRNIKKDVLREKILKFINHREVLMKGHGAFATEEKYKIIEQIRNNLSVREKSTLESNCQLIVDYAELLKKILPGKESVYHQSATQTLTEILEFCTLELKIKL